LIVVAKKLTALGKDHNYDNEKPFKRPFLGCGDGKDER
jgi:hypothetical protein